MSDPRTVAVEALADRAYTILVSAQPAVHRAAMQSPSDTALRLNALLEKAIQEWVDLYLADHGRLRST